VLSIGKSLQRGARALFGLSKAHYSLTISAKEHLVVLLEVVKKSKSNKGLKCIQASMPYQCRPWPFQSKIGVLAETLFPERMGTRGSLELTVA
jgi:hypothetical protein